jgi:hypothetical protein
MEFLTSLGSFVEFAAAIAAAVTLGVKVLPLAELLFTENLPEDLTSEA